MNKSHWVVILLIMVTALPSTGQTPNRTMTKAELHAALLASDGFGAGESRSLEKDGRRSVPLAFLLSAAVPGAGQAYNGHWLKAVGAVAAEAAIAAGYIINSNRGEAGRDAYRIYAHTFWSPTKYGFWLNDYKSYLNSLSGRPVNAPDVVIPTGIDFRDPGSWTMADQRAIREFFDAMRRLESDLYHAATGNSFAHRIPYFGEQQYYELIGKYFHFAVGWEDYVSGFDDEGNPTWNIDGEFLATVDPEVTDADGRPVHASDRYWQYAADHGRTNDYFRRASRISMLFFVNHVVAAVDAAVFAKLHNDRLSTRLSVHYDADGSMLPGAALSYRF